MIRRAQQTDCLKLLWEHGLLDCAYEQIAINYVDNLLGGVVDLARQTLAAISDIL